MILNKIDSNKYKKDFEKSFANFAEKAPIIISYFTDDLGVVVKHENSGQKRFYEWDFTIPVKMFIHNIKQDLSYFHYPRISRIESVPISAAKAAEYLAEGKYTTETLPATEEKTVIYRIDKILVFKDEFIIINEETGEQYCYKMDSSGVYFLKNYRTGKYKDPAEAGDAFFKKSTLVSILNKKA